MQPLLLVTAAAATAAVAAADAAPQMACDVSGAKSSAEVCDDFCSAFHRPQTAAAFNHHVSAAAAFRPAAPLSRLTACCRRRRADYRCAFFDPTKESGKPQNITLYRITPVGALAGPILYWRPPPCPAACLPSRPVFLPHRPRTPPVRPPTLHAGHRHACKRAQNTAGSQLPPAVRGCCRRTRPASGTKTPVRPPRNLKSALLKIHLITLL